MTPPRIQSLVECMACHRVDVALLDNAPLMESHTWRPDETGRCSAGGTGNWLERSLRHVEHPGHDDRCEAEFVRGPMLWTACRCADRA